MSWEFYELPEPGQRWPKYRRKDTHQGIGAE